MSPGRLRVRSSPSSHFSSLLISLHVCDLRLLPHAQSVRGPLPDPGFIRSHRQEPTSVQSPERERALTGSAGSGVSPEPCELGLGGAAWHYSKHGFGACLCARRSSSGSWAPHCAHGRCDTLSIQGMGRVGRLFGLQWTGWHHRAQARHLATLTEGDRRPES